MRVFMALIVVAALFAGFALRAETPAAETIRDYQVLHTADLIALDEGSLIDGATDPAGLPVELLFAPTQYLHMGGRTLLRDGVTGIACAPPRAALARIGAGRRLPCRARRHGPRRSLIRPGGQDLRGRRL